MSQPEPLTEQQLDEYEAAARNAARIGSGIDPAAVLELAAEVRRLTATLDTTRNKLRETGELAARRESELISLRAQLHSEKQVHRFSLRQRDGRSSRLVELRDLGDAAAVGGAAEVQALIDAARDTLAASRHDHPAAPSVAPLAAYQPSEAPVEGEAATRPSMGRVGDPRRTLTPNEYDAAWHAVEGAAGEEGADPGTVLHAVLDRLGIDWQDAAQPTA